MPKIRVSLPFGESVGIGGVFSDGYSLRDEEF